MDSIVTFFSENWEALSVIILWVASRVIKTSRNYDIFEMILKFLGDNIIPNRRSKKRGGGKIGLFFLLISSLFLVDNARGQTNGNFKSVRFQNAGSNEASIPLPSANNGAIYYNQGTNTFRAYQNGVWQDLIGGGGGGLATASNGLNVVGGTDVQLGGLIFSNIGLTVDSGNSLSLLDQTSNTAIGIVSNAIPGQEGAIGIGSGNGILIEFDPNNILGQGGGFYINDNRPAPNNIGLTYLNDYSANFTDRSIVDQGFVNTRLSGFLTGTTTASDFVNLGVNSFVFTSSGQSLNINQNGLFLGDVANAVINSDQSLAINSNSGGDLTVTSDNDLSLNSLGTATLSTQDLILGNSAPVSITSGAQTAGGNSGLVSIATGDATTGLAGNIIIQPGLGVGSARGSIQMSSFSNTMSLPEGQTLLFGSASPTTAQITCDENITVFGENSTFTTAPQATANSGGSSLASGSVSGGSGASGDVQLISGNSVGGATGDIVITTGIGGGQDGSIRLQGRVANGVYIILEDLPVSAVGLPSGALWNNAGVLNIAP